MRLRPCIDIHGGKVKQIVGSTLGSEAGVRAVPGAKGAPSDTGDPPPGVKENFVSELDAAYYAGIYREKGLPGGHVILLDPRERSEIYTADMEQALGALRAFPGGMQAGGGITPDNAALFLDAGASHVIVTSYVFRGGTLDRQRLEEMTKAVGRERLVLDLSCRCRPDGNYAVVTDRWQRFTDMTVCDSTLDMLCGLCDEFLIHAADVEGKRAGIERPLAALLGRWLKGRADRGEPLFPVTYAGGVRSTEDLRLLSELSGGMLDVTVGSALRLFGGDLTLDELLSIM